MKRYLQVLLVAGLLFTTNIMAETLSISADDSLRSVLGAYKDKRVTVKLKSGSELTGKVGALNNNLVQLKELSGKEFYDAVIDMDKVEAVIVRTKN